LLLEQWLRFYGPLTPKRICDTLGVDRGSLEAALAMLQERKLVVRGRLVEGSNLEQVCDRRNLQMLLRRARSRRRPVFEPLDIVLLPRFIALYQGLIRSSEKPEDAGAPGATDIPAFEEQSSFRTLQDCMEQLMGYPVEAGSWEEDIFPARIPGYDPPELDQVLQENDMTWFGCGAGKLGFCFEDEVELFVDEKMAGQEMLGELRGLFHDLRGRYTFDDLQEHTGLNPTALMKQLWKLAWKGVVANDRFEAVRRGVERGYDAAGEDRV
jgi:ATP-dependent Lhr-like helicase